MAYIFPIILLIIGVVIYRRGRRARQSRYIDEFQFPPAVVNRLKEARPQLSEKDQELVYAALRDYFHLCHRSGKRMVAMPSQVVDDAWHAFILFTRGYNHFCRHAFGRFLHHTPAEAMRSKTQAQDGIKRAWRLACAAEGIDPKEPSRLPLLFSIDSDLGIEDGFIYALNCKEGRVDGRTPANAYCASHIGCGGGCAGDSGASSGGDGGGDGGFFSGDSGGDGGCGGD